MRRVSVCSAQGLIAAATRLRTAIEVEWMASLAEDEWSRSEGYLASSLRGRAGERYAKAQNSRWVHRWVQQSSRSHNEFTLNEGEGLMRVTAGPSGDE